MHSRMLLVGCLLAGASATARAQGMEAMHHDGDYAEAHSRAFTSGDPKGSIVGAPHLDIAGGYYRIGGERAGENSAVFFRAHIQYAIGSPVVQIASDIQFLPKFTGANPTFAAVVQVAPVKASSPLFLAAGIGVISGHNGDRMAGWLQATAALRTPLHAVAIFGQIGKSLVSGSNAELLLGVQHPLSPFRYHGSKG